MNEAASQSEKPRSKALALGTGGVIGALGGLIGLGGAEFRLPVLIGVFQFAALEAVILNKAMSLVVVATALPFRAQSVPWADIAASWPIILNLLAGSLIGAWFGAGWATRVKSSTLYKVIAYTLSALFCGTVGAAYASWTGYIDPTDSFSIIMTVKVPVMCLLGGPGTVLGPVIGTAAFTLLEEVFWANFLDYNRAILGAVIVVLIFFLPGGLLAISYRDIGARLFGRRKAAA